MSASPEPDSQHIISSSQEPDSKLFIETATNGIAILNQDKFIYINQAHLDIFGYSHPEELLGKSWRILYQP
ncbi:MAG: PAS domain-containing protein [Cyanobacteria bacterium P01_G01_bin.67]